ncbi:class F sortase [Streptomyces sp. NPDC059569]|uniref:class F sortase n=1 Tax=Streptomyces sp. NPDC059569 TaxID=3346869 RepID=UPI0036BB84C5
MAGRSATPGVGRLLAGVTWAVLLLVLWLWGRDASEGPGGWSALTTGDVAAVGRPQGVVRPPARAPLDPAEPRRVEVPSMGIDAPVVPRGLDGTGAIDPPPYATPRAVGWYGGGVQPGAEGAALFVGHADTETKPAVFHGLSAARPGAKIRVARADGRTAEFTIDEVRVFGRDRFDAHKVYGPHKKSRAELRLITCGGTFDRATDSYTANVVVSAYLTGVSEPRDS